MDGEASSGSPTQDATPGPSLRGGATSIGSSDSTRPPRGVAARRGIEPTRAQTSQNGRAEP
eukprot:13254248-Alexandrium_andersonii.AAC.1